MKGYAIRLLVSLFGAVPLRIAHTFGALVGRIAYVFGGRLRKVTEINLARCLPELSETERGQLARASLAETGKTFAELGALWLWPARRLSALTRAVVGEEALQAALASGNGAIVVSPHLGAWELVGLYLSQRYPTTSLYRPPRMVDLEHFVRGARERFGATLVPTDRKGVRAMYEALARGEVVGVLADQEPGKGAGVFAPFFGHAAWTMVLVARLASRSGAAVFFGYALRLPRGRGYEIRFRPLDELSSSADLAPAASALNRGVEACVRQRPEQYQWSYKRFKTRPPGEERWY